MKLRFAGAEPMRDTPVLAAQAGPSSAGAPDLSEAPAQNHSRSNALVSQLARYLKDRLPPEMPWAALLAKPQLKVRT